MTYFFNLNRFLCVSLFVLISSLSYAQDLSQLKEKTNASQQYLKFAPSNLRATDINPSDIPLARMFCVRWGFLKWKSNRPWIISFKKEHTTQTLLILRPLILINFRPISWSPLLVTLFPYNDSIKYPIAKVYGQNFLGNQTINFFTDLTTVKHPPII